MDMANLLKMGATAFINSKKVVMLVVAWISAA